MSGQSEQSRDPADWLAIADEDVDVAGVCLTHAPPLLRAACFHAHDAAEKYLKAYLVSQDVEFPWTHDLRVILRLCADQDSAFEALRDRAAQLAGIAVAPRYPFPHFEPTLELAEEGISAAEHVGAFVRERIGG